MKTKNKIQQNYFDALFFASADSNNKKDYYLRPVEFKLLLKLIHYSTDQPNITWQSKDISVHTSMCIGAIDKGIQRLRQKGYITTSTYNVKENVKHRTIFINWNKIDEVDGLYKLSLSNNTEEIPSTENKAPESTIPTQYISEVQVEDKVSEIEDIEVVYEDLNIIDVYKTRANKLFKYRVSDEHFDKQINDMDLFLKDVGYEKMSQLDDKIRPYLKLEIRKDNGEYDMVYLFNNKKELV